MLLRSSKPSLHANVDCNALVAAIVSRQVPVVRLLLQVTILVLDHHCPHWMFSNYYITICLNLVPIPTACMWGLSMLQKNDKVP